MTKAERTNARKFTPANSAMHATPRASSIFCRDSEKATGNVIMRIRLTLRKNTVTGIAALQLCVKTPVQNMAGPLRKRSEIYILAQLDSKCGTPWSPIG